MAPEAEKYIREIIRKAIDEVAFEELKKMPAKKERFFDELKKSAQQRADLAHKALFYGGNESNLQGIRRRISLSESERPKVNVSDIEHFENEIRKFISNATINLDKQANGLVLSFPPVPNGIEVYASGTITFEQGQVIKFKISLLNGLTVDMINFKLTHDNKVVLEQLYNFYHKWSEYWREVLSNEEKEEQEAAEMPEL